MSIGGYLEHSSTADFDPAAGLMPTEWLSALSFGWLSAFSTSINYLPVVIPFALATVVGGQRYPSD